MFYENRKRLFSYWGKQSIGWVLLLLTSCAPVTSLEPAPSDLQTSIQTLPISATLMVRAEIIELEVAATPEQQAIGLMHRTELPDNRGMVFVFDPPKVSLFWMKDTLIPLDMLFLSGDRVIALYKNVPPCKKDPCPVYGPRQNVDRVVELRGGRAEELGIQRGDILKIKFQER